ncbi:MAG TPA: hypothetical protein VFD56_03955, partial [Chitinophagaceae bacterium]|nr:hypothetical protein [Chitinophagaceae bacterium]
IEMRDKVADPLFLLQKKIESRLHEKFPEKWIPAYSQVTFSPNIRYSDALKNGKRQDNIMRAVMLSPQFQDKLKSEEIDDIIIKMADKLRESSY